MPPSQNPPADPLCHYYQHPPDSAPSRNRTIHRHRLPHPPTAASASSSASAELPFRAPKSSLSASLSRSFPRLAPLADPLDYIARLCSTPLSSSPLRTSRSLRHAMRKASYLHILILPALLLLFLELPGPVLYPKRLYPEDTLLPPVHPANHYPALAPLSRVIAPDHPILPGVSIVACCMNRHETLRTVLARWRAVANVSEIIIVDWSSNPPLRDVVEHVADADPRVRLIRVDGEEQWILSRAYNLAVRATSFDKILRTDCDYSIGNQFVNSHDLTDHRDGLALDQNPEHADGPVTAMSVAPNSLQKPKFYAGNYQHARNENEVHLNGAVYIKRADFLRIGGYDERIQTYGWDDEDLYGRLVEAGLQKKDINYDHVSHVPHGDNSRAQKDVKFVQVEIDLNSLLLKHLPKWNSSAVDRHEWQLSDHAPHTDSYAVLIAVTKPRSLKDLVAPPNVTSAWNMALGQRLANDYQVPWDIMETMDVTSKRSLLVRLNKRMEHRAPSQAARILFAHCMHGLGNRLRALGSAMSFAKQTDRELVVIWETDAHIAAKFTDLFKDDLVTITHFKPSWPFRGYDKWDKAWLNFEFFNYMEMEGQGAVKGQKIIDKPDKHFYFKSAYVMEADTRLTNWDKDNEMLRSLAPVSEVTEMIKQHENKGLEQMVGIHIRDRTLDRDIKNVNFGTEYGDAASKEMEYWRRKSSYKTFMVEMHKMVKKDSSLRFYVATDTIDVIPKLEAEFPGKIISTSRNCDGRDGHCVRYALVDIICLSRTKELIGSNWSSFTEAASRIGGKKARLAGQDFAVDTGKNV